MPCPNACEPSATAWEYMLSEWLPESGFAVGHGNFCEVFPAGTQFTGEPGSRELLLPVRLLRST